VSVCAQTPERQALGIAFPLGYIDTTLLIITKLEKEGEKLHILGVFSPFDQFLWVCIVAMMIFSSFVYWFVEREAEDCELYEDGVNPVGNSIYLIFSTPVGAAGIGPKTLAGKIFSWSWSFWCLLVTAAYTATLASAFTVQAVASSEISTVADLQAANKPLCLVTDGGAADFMVRRYPTIPKFYVDDEQSLYSAMSDGECNAAVTNNQYWHEFRNQRATNAGCQFLSPAGSAIMQGEGGFVVKADSGGKDGRCSSLIRDVFDLHMNEMWIDGFVEKEMDFFFLTKSDIVPPCPSSGPVSGVGGDGQTDVYGMAGTFIIHAAFSTVSIVIAVVTSLFKKGGRLGEKKAVEREREENGDEDKSLAGSKQEGGLDAQSVKTILELLQTQGETIANLSKHLQRLDSNMQQVLNDSDDSDYQKRKSQTTNGADAKVGPGALRSARGDAGNFPQLPPRLGITRNAASNSQETLLGRLSAGFLEFSQRIVSPREEDNLPQLPVPMVSGPVAELPSRSAAAALPTAKKAAKNSHTTST